MFKRFLRTEIEYGRGGRPKKLLLATAPINVNKRKKVI
jgi:hypothetical protein